MKSLILTLLLLLSSPLIAAGFIDHELLDVFVVPKGYDTNDEIEVTYLTKLPSSCFGPADVRVSKLGKREFQIDFFIKKKSLSGCDNSRDTRIKSPTYHDHTISLGELEEGEYSIYFKRQGRKLKRSFIVDKKKVNTVDDNHYAPITRAFIPSLIHQTLNAQVILSGILPVSCMYLPQNEIEVYRYGNIFVVIPKAKFMPGDCRETEIPLQSIVSLGEIKRPGAYLIHIRSQSGLSINKVFHVREKELDYRGM